MTLNKFYIIYSTLFFFFQLYTFPQKSWQAINNGLTTKKVLSIEINPQNTKNIYVGTENGLFHSFDGGEKWFFSSNQLNGLRITEIIIDPLEPNNLYISTSKKGVLKSVNKAKNWVAINNGLPTLNIPQLAISTDKNSILLSGPDGFGVFKSKNKGKYWYSVGRGRDVREIVFDPANPNIAYISTVQSILKTIDYGESWFYCGDNLPNPFINGLAIDPINTNTLYSGPAQNGIWKTTNGAKSWYPSNNGIEYGVTIIAIVVNHSNPDIVYAISNKKGIYISFDGGNYWRGFNKGLSSKNISRNALKIDPLNAGIVYIGTSTGVYKINFAGAH